MQDVPLKCTHVYVLYLSSGNGADDLPTVCAHHFTIRRDDVTSQSQTTVVCQDICKKHF